MVDLTKPLQRAQQGIERRNWDLVIEICQECIEIEPTNLEIYRLLIEAARRKAKEAGKASFMSSLRMPSFSKDPHKLLAQSMVRMANQFDGKTTLAAAEAAMNLAKTIKPMGEVAILFFEEFRRSGLFNAQALWDLAHLYYEKFNRDKTQVEHLDKAIKTMAELEKAKPDHPDASRLVKNWEAARSLHGRHDKAGGSAGGGDFRSQLASDDKARKLEVMNRIIRTVEDAREVLAYVDQDLAASPGDKNLWLKKGDTHRRINELPQAREAFEKAQQLDAFDFTVTMRLGDVVIAEQQAAIRDLEAAGQDATDAKRKLLEIEIAEYRVRCERQPTEMTHHYNLGTRLLQAGQVEVAAAEFQRTVNDPRYRRPSHKYLGYCFQRKNLLDLAVQQYTSFLSLVEDALSDEAKEVRYLRGRQLEDLGKRDEAVVDYSKLVEMDLGYKDAAERLNKLRAG
jgi:tetratricopeptide (TPR) repeat protein